jgi:hypothetical protein
MKKTVALLFAVIFIAAVSLTACDGKDSAVTGSDETITITDHNGDTVTLPKKDR